MRYQHYFDPTFARLSNLLSELAIDLLMSTATARPSLAGKTKYQAQNQLNILCLPVVLTIEADPVCA